MCCALRLIWQAQDARSLSTIRPMGKTHVDFSCGFTHDYHPARPYCKVATVIIHHHPPSFPRHFLPPSVRCISRRLWCIIGHHLGGISTNVTVYVMVVRGRRCAPRPLMLQTTVPLPLPRRSHTVHRLVHVHDLVCTYLKMSMPFLEAEPEKIAHTHTLYGSSRNL